MSLWNRVKTIALILITTVLVQAQQSEKTNKPAQTGPGTASSVTAIEGTWAVTPLLLKGAATPGGSGQLLEFGEAYQTSSFLAFWARTGPDAKKDWVLFSWKDGQLTRVLQRGVEFVAPDSHKVIVRADTPIHVGKRLLYFTSIWPHHIYAWDGEKLVKVLSAGDELQFGNERYTIKRASVLDASPDGRALIGFENHTDGWAVHDGSSFTPVLKRGGELPGMPGVRIENFCRQGRWGAIACETPRLLDDGSVLASLTVSEGGRKRSSLFRIFPQRTEVMVEQDTAFVGCDAQRLILPSEAPVRVTTQCGAYTFTFNRGEAGKPLEMEMAEVISDKQTSSVQKKSLGVVSKVALGGGQGLVVTRWIAPSVWEKRLRDVSQIRLGEKDNSVLVFSWITPRDVLSATPQAFAMDDVYLNQILVSYAGKLWMVEYDSIGDLRDHVYSWVSPARDSPRSLAELVDFERKGFLGIKIRSYPHLYFWNGEKLSSVAWEESVGISTATVADLLQRHAYQSTTGGGLETYEEAEAAGRIAHFRIRAIPGPIGGVRVQLPDLGVKPRTWYVPANSTDGKLQQPPRFPLAEHAISLADVISWKEDEVLALSEEGLFRLRRAKE
jgi:hypothetical protein